MAQESVWRKQRQKDKGGKGDYWLLSRSNGSKTRESISLGYGLREEEAAKCEAGINFLVEFRNRVNRPPTRGPLFKIGPPPATVDEIFPLPGPGLSVPIYVSPDHLKRMLREASNPPERAVAQDRVRAFLLKLADARPADQRPLDDAAVERSVQEIARAAKVGSDRGEMPLKLYHESIWVAERKAKRPTSWEGEETR